MSGDRETGPPEAPTSAQPVAPNWSRIAWTVALIALPLAIGWWYRAITSLPGRVVIATGPANGRYREVAGALAESLDARWSGTTVAVVHTSGSVENLRLLRAGEVDFAIVQADVAHAHADDEGPGEPVDFVGNLYSEVVHLVVREGVEVAGPGDLRGKTVNIGPRDSGDRRTAVVVLAHLGLDLEDVTANDDDYEGVRDGFVAGTLDAAFITTSLGSPVLRMLVETGDVRLVAIPFATTLADRRLAMASIEIPPAYYGLEPAEPATALPTVAVRAQLLCRENLPSNVVSEVASTVTGRSFVKDHGLAELYSGEEAFARAEPAFDLHDGAEQVYDPELEPLLDPNFVEATEGLRSFAVSLLIGLYLLYRWYRERRLREEEHALDEFIHRLLELERRQLALDDTPGSGDLEALQRMLDELTELRQEALADFSAHSLREDPATDTFLEMCHALSDKINAKIARQRMDRSIGELVDAVGGAGDDPSDAGAPSG